MKPDRKRDLADAPRSVTQLVFRESDPPMRQIFDWSRAHELLETRGELRPRHAADVRHVRDGPVASHVFVDRSDRTRRRRDRETRE